MKHTSTLTASAVLSLTVTAASTSNSQACPLLGQQYPSPTKLSSEPKFQAATSALDAALNSKLNSFPVNETTFSIGMFSASDDGLLYQYHHTDALVSNSTSGGRKVDANSVYRIGSISKLLTMYMFLISNGDRCFNEPITNFVPQLLGDGPGWNSLTPSWSDITVGDIASQMGGLARDYGFEDIAPPGEAFIPVPAALRAAFPHLPSSEVPKCAHITSNGSIVPCSVHEYLEGLATESPVFPTAYTPAYSNEGFALLGIALSNIANEPLEALFNRSLVEPLHLSGTYYNVPSTITDHDVIPGNALLSGWNANLGVASTAGGFFSSLNDMATIGKAILNNTLLSTSQTRRWLKPTAFVEAFDQGVGRPWEIFRLKVGGQSVDLYTKSGDYGAYHSFHAIVPTYGFGFTVLVAEDPGSNTGELVRAELPNVIAEAIMPVLDEIARDQATVRFAGTYSSESTNSSLTIASGAKAGLMITQWINNGIDLLGDVFEVFLPDLNYRILPNQLYDGNLVGFTSYYQSETAPPNGSFFWPCSGWTLVDGVTYGNIPVGQLVFEVDGDGNATSVQLRALRTTLQKQ